MVGLGEEWAEVEETIRAIRDAGHRHPHRRPVPAALAAAPAGPAATTRPRSSSALRALALGLGFAHVESGPLVRSSYHAGAAQQCSEAVRRRSPDRWRTSCRRSARHDGARSRRPRDRRRPRVVERPSERRSEDCTRSGGEAHRAQHVRGLDAARRAGGAGRDRDALEVEGDQQGLGLDALERDVGGVRQPRARRRCGGRPGSASSRASSRSRSARDARRLGRRGPRARARAAAPKPTMPATFSVPARRLRSWPPPRTSGAIGVPRRT